MKKSKGLKMTACNRYLIDPYSLYNRNQLMNKLGVSRDSINKIVNDITCKTDSKIQTFKGIDIGSYIIHWVHETTNNKKGTPEGFIS